MNNPDAARKRPRWVRVRHGQRHRCAAAFVLLPLLLSSVARAGEVQLTEPMLKAMFLLRFAPFVQWPQGQRPNLVGFLGPDDPVAAAAETLMLDTSDQQWLLKKATDVSEITKCHIVFVSGRHQEEMRGILSAMDGLPILSVSDQPDFARMGGMIGFYIADNKLRFEINRKRCEAAGLLVSAKLLALARIVEDELPAE